MIRSDTADAVLTLTLDRPEVGNALDARRCRDLAEAVRAAGRDGTIRAIIITGSGSTFCSGLDTTGVGEAAEGGTTREPRPYTRLILQLRRLEKPVLAAVNGVAAGAGFGLALACDLRIAAEGASFAPVGGGEPVPEGSSLYFLPRIVGLAKALELCLLGEPVGADGALRLGLVSRVVPSATLRETADELARKLAAGAGVALALTKRGLNRALESDWDGMLEYEALLQEVAGQTADFREGVFAFSEKRSPRFRGA